MTLRVWGESGRPRRLTPADDGGPGTRYLAGARRRARLTACRKLDTLRSRLGALVQAERVERHDRPPLLATVQHLVPARRGAQYLAAWRRAGPRWRRGGSP